MEKLFGTDGIRAKAGTFPLDEKTIETIGGSLARHFSEKLGRSPRFVTGRDTRESGAWIEKAFHKGAVSENAYCQSADIITTPGVAFLTEKFGFDAGIVISASHNPFEDNGIKIFSPSGKRLTRQLKSKSSRIFSTIQNLKIKIQNRIFKSTRQKLSRCKMPISNI
jgi:phosphoglucosamine mutase